MVIMHILKIADIIKSLNFRPIEYYLKKRYLRMVYMIVSGFLKRFIKMEK